jgi:hypothetical protein
MLALFLMILIHYISRMNITPYKERNPKYTVLIGCLLALFIISQTLPMLIPQEDYEYYWAPLLPLGAMMYLYIHKAMVIGRRQFRTELQENSFATTAMHQADLINNLSTLQGDVVKSAKLSKFTKHSGKVNTIAGLITFFSCGLTALLVEEKDEILVVYVFLIHVGISMCVIVYLAAVMGRKQDHVVGLKNELRHTGIGGALSLVVVFGSSLVVDSNVMAAFCWSTVVKTACITVTVSWSLLYPYFVRRRTRKRRTQYAASVEPQLDTSDSDFEAFVETKRGFYVFTQYARSEWSLEFFAMFLRLTRFQQSYNTKKKNKNKNGNAGRQISTESSTETSPDMLSRCVGDAEGIANVHSLMQEEAKSILRVFLSKDRAWSIQLPRALLNRVAENVETDSTNICPHVFDEAREFLLDMLRDGIWKRFLASKLYRAFRKEQWAEKAKEEATRKVQERLEVMVIRRHDAVEENLFEIPERLAVETHHQLIAVDERDGVKIENYRRLDQGSVRQMTRQDCCQL